MREAGELERKKNMTGELRDKGGWRAGEKKKKFEEERRRKRSWRERVREKRIGIF